MNIDEFADLLTSRTDLPAEALEALAEYANISVYNLYLPTGEISLNNMTTRITGYDLAELPHTENTKSMLTFEDDRGIVEEAMQSLMSGESSRYYIEYRMKRHDGSLVSIGENGLVLERDESGTPTRICALAQDLSRLRWAEEKARRMDKENRVLAGTVGYTDILDRNRMLRASNAAAAMIIGGYHQEYETVLKQALQIIAESIDADRAYIMRNTVKDGKVSFFLRSVWDKDISIKEGDESKAVAYDDVFPDWKKDFDDQFSMRSRVEDIPPKLRELLWFRSALSVMIVPLYLQGEFFGLIGFENRTTGRAFKEDEADVMRTGAMVIAASIMRNETLRQLNKAREAAISGTRAKSEFLSRMSHEIRTPINAIIGMTTLAKKNSDPETLSYYLDMIDVSSKQLLGLINDILDMSKVDEGKLEILSEPFDFGEMLAGVVQMIEVKTGEKHQKLVIDASLDLSREMIGDSLRLSQILINLMSNATKFTPDGGRITLELTEKQGRNMNGSGECPWLQVSVSDTGIGISREQQKRLFQVFEQADGSITRTYGGSGLGLSICKKIIALMGGSIRAESEEGKGSVFIFEIPVKWGEKVVHREAAGSLVPDTGAPDWHGRTILLAEDIDINREIVVGMLEDTGIEIIPAVNGEETLSLFRGEPGRYDLILMDVQMPTMDGLTATKLIRGMDTEASAHVPILAMTANAFKEDIDTCLAAGMNAHIAKPIDIDDLIHTIAQYL